MQLATDPSSHLCAAVNEWTHPLSREAIVLADLFDLTGIAHTNPKKRRPKPHPIRPWAARKKERFGNPGNHTPDEVRELLSLMGRGLLTS